MNDQDKTHFGFEQVPLGEKAKRVADVFDSVASRYDIMNDVMSMGVHRLWKRFAINAAHLRPGQKILDLAGGTGDLAISMARKIGDDGLVVLSDINANMLTEGRTRVIDAGLPANIRYAQASAESLPFPDNHFDLVTIAFGLRNVTDKPAALQEMYRVLKPGGSLLILEFSKPVVPGLSPLYDLYSFQIIPRMGKLITGDDASYRYLAESIRMHPDQDTLKGMVQDAGFENSDYFNLTGGIVALHRGYKF